MKKFKLGSQAISALMLALAITGCGSSSDNASFTTKSESAKGVMNSATYYEDSAAETAAATEDFNETGDSTTEVDESTQRGDEPPRFYNKVVVNGNSGYYAEITKEFETMGGRKKIIPNGWLFKSYYLNTNTFNKNNCPN